MDILWGKAIKIIKEKVSQHNFDTWIRPIQISALDGEFIQLRVPNRFFRDWLIDNYLPLIREAMKSEAGILMPNGDVFRPDKVFFSQHETVIMEFKTGLPKPEHEKQVHHYGEILQQMGYPGIRKLLVYLDDEIKVNEL